MSHAQNGARIKVWPDTPSSESADLQGGGGTGAVHNVTYDTMRVKDVDYAIQITQCYGQDNTTLCDANPSKLTVSDVVMQDFFGTTSGKYGDVVGSLVCSSPKVCSGITVKDIHVSSPGGKDEFVCHDLGASQLQGLNCTGSS